MPRRPKAGLGRRSPGPRLLWTLECQSRRRSESAEINRHQRLLPSHPCVLLHSTICSADQYFGLNMCDLEMRTAAGPSHEVDSGKLAAWRFRVEEIPQHRDFAEYWEEEYQL
jgi:hypothetical protein